MSRINATFMSSGSSSCIKAQQLGTIIQVYAVYQKNPLHHTDYTVVLLLYARHAALRREKNFGQHLIMQQFYGCN